MDLKRFPNTRVAHRVIADDVASGKIVQAPEIKRNRKTPESSSKIVINRQKHHQSIDLIDETITFHFVVATTATP